MAIITQYMLPIEQYLTAKTWVTEGGSYQNGHLSVNDEAGVPGSVFTVPTVNTSTYVNGNGSDGSIFYPSISYWRFGAIPLAATDIHVKMHTEMAVGHVGPRPRACSFLASDFSTKYKKQQFSLALASDAGFVWRPYEWDMGAYEPFTSALWSAAFLNSLWWGLEATEDTTYASFCAAAWLEVTYNDGESSGGNPPATYLGGGILL